MRSALTAVSGRSSVTTAMVVASLATNLSDRQPAIIVTARVSSARTPGVAQTVAEAAAIKFIASYLRVKAN